MAEIEFVELELEFFVAKPVELVADAGFELAAVV